MIKVLAAFLLANQVAVVLLGTTKNLSTISTNRSGTYKFLLTIQVAD